MHRHMWTIATFLLGLAVAACGGGSGGGGGGSGDPEPVLAPTLSPAPGAFDQDVSVTITTATPGASIHYTLDGNDPTGSSLVYANPITVSGDNTTVEIRAVASKDGMLDSPITTGTYTVDYLPVDAPTLKDSSGNVVALGSSPVYASDQMITLETATPGASIYYTLNGTDPTTASSIYGAAIAVAGHGTTIEIRARATADQMEDSSVSQATIGISYTQLGTPTFDTNPGQYTSDLVVRVQTQNPDETLHYTTDGTDPISSGTVLSATDFVDVSITGDEESLDPVAHTVRAYASKTGMADSLELSGGFTIALPQEDAPFFTPTPGSTITAQESVYANGSGGGATVLYNIAINSGSPADPTFSGGYDGSGQPVAVIDFLDTSTFPDGASIVLRARAHRTGWRHSTVTEASYTLDWATAATPTLSHSGTYDADLNNIVQLLSGTGGATIYYTTDGTTPDDTSLVYSTPLSVTGDGTSTTFKAIAIADGYKQSGMLTDSVTIDWAQVADIQASPVAGQYNATTQVTLSTATAGVDIYYTANGSTPDAGSIPYSGPMPIGSTVTIKAIGIKAGMKDSNIFSGTYIIDRDDPVPGGGLATGAVDGGSVALSWTRATDNVSTQAALTYQVYYSTSGTLPDLANTLAATPFGTAAANIDQITVNGLNDGTTYWFNVVVTDVAGNQAVYTSVSATTDDTTAPAPGNSGIMSASNQTFHTLTLSWTKAADNVSAGANITYAVYVSDTNNIDTVANAEINGTLVTSQDDIATAPVSALPDGNTTYYFNIVVSDQAGNKTIYGMQPFATANLVESDEVVHVWSQNRTWRRCPGGMAWDGTNCTGSALQVRFCGTLDNSCQAGGTDTGTLISGSLFNSCDFYNTNPAGGLDGRTNWRAPSVIELASHFGTIVANPTIFPDHPTSIYYWTGTGVSGDATRALECTLSYGGYSCPLTSFGVWKTSLTSWRAKCVSAGAE